MKMHFGIDYGSKMAGTTAICYNQDAELLVINSEKKKDADQFISESIELLNPAAIYLDAPLSIPAAYYGKGGSFHYRECDRLTSAMSPMFLGGLTARAMSLRQQNQKFPFYECYPSYLIREVLKAKEHYNKKEGVPNDNIISIVQDSLSYKIPSLQSYHQLDAVLCWLTGQRHVHLQHLELGEKQEGLILV